MNVRTGSYVPDLLYKFRGSWDDQNNKDVLINNSLFFSSIKNFNDPFDSQAPFVLDKATPEERIESFKQTFEKSPYVLKKNSRELAIQSENDVNFKQNLLNDLLIRIDKDISENVGICCFASDENNCCLKNNLLWSHYANSHKGFCVVYKAEAMIQYLNERNDIIGWDNENGYHGYSDILEVDYKPECPELDVVSPDKKKEINKRLSTKSSEWKYEGEYRAIFIDKTNFAEYLPNDLIKKIVLGCRMPEAHKNEIIPVVLIEIEEIFIDVVKYGYELQTRRIY